MPEVFQADYNVPRGLFLHVMSSTEHINPCLVLPLSYIEFAREETNLFRLLFYKPYGFEYGGAKGFLYGGRQRGEGKGIF